MSGKCNGMIAGVLRTSCLVLSLSAVLLMPMPAFAFKPTAGHGHAGMTLEVLESLEVKTKEGAILKFSKLAQRQVIDGAEAVDHVFGERAEFRGHPEAHCDDESLGECSQRIIDLKKAIIEQLTSAEGLPYRARAELGRAVHTLQDFYAHSNWVNDPGPAKTTINTDLGRNVIAKLTSNQDTCVDDVWDATLDQFGLNSVTSGYFALAPGANPPSGKCAHGWGDPRNEPIDLRTGINKCYPGRRFFDEARNLAKLATVDFINQILESPGIKDDTTIIASLLNYNGSLGFVVDDTASMSPTINGVKKVITKIIQAVKDDPARKPEEYILVRYGEDVGAPFITKSAEELLNRVNALTANGGGDCPEKSMGGLLTAINAASVMSTIHLFTDASAKDAGLSKNMEAAAWKKKIIVEITATGSCSPIDPTYGEITRETGGQLVVLNNTEADVEKYFEIIQSKLTGDLEPIMIISDNLASTASRYNILVDSTITNLLVSVNMDAKGSIQLFRPNGTEVLPGNGGVSITELPNGRVVKVSAPVAGLWQLSIGGTSGTRYSASVMGNSPIRFDRFQFVESKGNVGHLGLFRIDGQPVSGAASTAVATLYGPHDPGTPLVFQMLSEPGFLLATPTLSGSDNDVTKEDFVGAVTLPTERFRVYVLGKDANGFWFRRALPPTFLGQAVQVEALHKESDLVMIAGKPFTARFKVTNRGSDNKFKISAADDRGFVKSVSQSEVTLAANASAQIDVALAIPGDTAANTVVMLSLVATGTTPTTENFAVFSRPVEAGPPPDTGGTSAGGSGGGGCFIATAVYGPGRAEEIELLKRFRDDYLLTNPVGRALVRVYYAYSPPVARFLERHEAAKAVTRTAFKPLVFGLQHPMLCLFSACFLVGIAFTWRKRRRNNY